MQIKYNINCISRYHLTAECCLTAQFPDGAIDSKFINSYV